MAATQEQARETLERVLAALAEHDPALVSLGGSGTSVSALVPEARLAETVRALHRTFFEEGR